MSALLIPVPRTNLLTNPGWDGVTDLPSGWADGVGKTGNRTRIDDDIFEFDCANKRAILQQTKALLANSIYIFLVQVLTRSGGSGAFQFIYATNLASLPGATLALNGDVADTPTIISVTVTTAGTGGNVNFRTGVGCNSNTTATLRIKAPSLYKLQ